MTGARFSQPASPTSVDAVALCHRVVRFNVELTGYGGGLAAKERLLELGRGTAAA